jgi:hypothetical protein
MTCASRRGHPGPVSSSEVLVDFLVWLLILFVIFLVAGWGWRAGRGR